MDFYETKSGDSWDYIAFKVYGNEKYLIELMQANPEHMRTRIFSGGVKLVCPDIALSESNILPPWKRGRKV